MRIALDTAGGEHPDDCLEGALLALEQAPDLDLAIVALTTHETAMRQRLNRARSDVRDRITLYTASKVVPSHIEEGMVTSVRRNRETTMARAFTLIAEQKADGLVSAGNTAGLVTLGGLLGRYKGTKHALASAIPSTAGHDVVYVDAGANPDTTAEQLAQNMRWGAFIAETLYERQKPQGAFLNVGLEKGKGGTLIAEAHAIIADEGEIQLAGFGNAEPDHVFSGELPTEIGEEEGIRLDVVAADGKSGNVGLKTLKASAKALLTFLQQRLRARSRLSPIRLAKEAAALTLLPTLLSILDDYQDKVGGGTLMGVDGVVTKVHGSSKAQHVKGGILRTHKLAESGFLEKLRAFHRK